MKHLVTTLQKTSSISGANKPKHIRLRFVAFDASGKIGLVRIILLYVVFCIFYVSPRVFFLLWCLLGLLCLCDDTDACLYDDYC